MNNDGILKVDSDELFNVNEIIKKDSDSYDEIIERMLKLIEVLRTTWEGKDADEYCDNFKEYLERMKDLPKNMRTISEGVKKITSGYVDKDQEFGKELQKGVLENEREEVKNS